MSFSSIDIDIIVNTGRHWFECTKAYYLPIYGLRKTVNNFRHCTTKNRYDQNSNSYDFHTFYSCPVLKKSHSYSLSSLFSNNGKLRFRMTSSLLLYQLVGFLSKGWKQNREKLAIQFDLYFINFFNLNYTIYINWFMTKLN